MPFRKSIFLTVLSVLLSAVFARAQEQSDSDSLVRLNYGKTAELLEIDGQSIRKVIGPAEFLHNNTYMLCDTALWNIDTGIIDAIGNVSLIQEGTTLTSDKMKYLVDDDLAQFRGTLVELVDSARNVLRTSYLDYNTKDSIGVFNYGGSMRDKDGQLIESIQGTYEAKEKLFTFVDDVNMFTDSIFVKTTRLEYRSDLNLATFGRETDAWKEENMLSADAGWYDRDREIFFFRNNVHVMNDTQEGWSDSLYFYRNSMNVDMLGNAQVSDSTRNVSGLAGVIMYNDSLARVTMLRDPAVVGLMEQDEKVDTVYASADTIVYYTLMMYQIPESVLTASAKRVEELAGDPVGAYRAAAAEAARKAAQEALENDPNYRPPTMEDEGDVDEEEEEGGSGRNARIEDEDEDEDDELLGLPPLGAKEEEPVEEEPPEEEAQEVVEEEEVTEVAEDVEVPETEEEVEPPEEETQDVVEEPDDAEDSENEAEKTENDVDNQQNEADNFGRDSLAARDSLISARDSLSASRDERIAERSALRSYRDSTGVIADSLKFLVDSLGYTLDSLGVLRDSEGFVLDSLGVGADSLLFMPEIPLGPLDSTKVNFIWANGNIRMFKDDMQMVCDSLEYCDLDSLTRLYRGTVIWNEITQQYSADSVMVVFRNGGMEKANLMSEAYIIIEEEKDVYFDQIKSVEAIAYFGGGGELSRFDALGSANGAFFLREEDVVATVNKTDSKMLSAIFTDGEIDKVYYFDDIKSDAYPVVQLPKEEQTYKGFLWQPELRPDSPEAVTKRKPRQSMREKYASHPRAAFDFTEMYFPGYIPGIYLEIQQRDSLERIHAAERREAAARRDAFLADSLERADLYNLLESTSVIDTVALADTLFLADSLAKADRKVLREEKKKEKAIADSIALADSLAKPHEEKVLTPEEIKALAAAVKAAEKEAARAEKEAERELARAEREAERVRKLAEREAKWAYLDSLDEAKELEKAEKKLEVQRKKKLKALLKADAKNAVEEAILEKYVQKIEKKEAKKEEKAAKKAAKRLAKKKAKAEKKGVVEMVEERDVGDEEERTVEEADGDDENHI